MKTTITLEPSMTVNEVIAAWPETIAVFNSFGIDLCCGGDDTLELAARESGVDLENLLDALVKAGAAR
ncbi:MAG TPA: DUF542 domain-containing protein [Gemmatimonadaceae bacterium]